MKVAFICATSGLTCEPPDPWEHKGGSWVCGSCSWEGDPDLVGDKCPGCGRLLENEQ